MQVTASVVSTAKVQKIWEQFTTIDEEFVKTDELFRLQKYKKFESNSQLIVKSISSHCVVSTAKVQKIWEQFTTHHLLVNLITLLFRLQKYKKFESNSQLFQASTCSVFRCFDCKSTKNLRAIHNLKKQPKTLEELFRLQKYKKFESNSQPKRTAISV